MHIFQNTFEIRAKIPFKFQILLGFIPILLILLVWKYITTGSIETITLPIGYISVNDNQITPYPGYKIYSTVSYYIKDYEIFTPQNTDEIHIFNKKNNHLVNLKGFTAHYKIKSDDIIYLKLPPGVFKNRKILQSANQHTNIECIDFQYEKNEDRIISTAILPSPIEVLYSTLSLWNERKPFYNIYISFKRVLFGFLAALVISLPISLLMGCFTFWKCIFSPTITISGYLPIPALVPLTLSLFGTTELQKVMFLALAFVIYLIPLFVKALEEVDNVYIQTAYTLGASKLQVVFKVLLAIALPNIYDAMRLGFGVGWSYILLVEMVDMGAGGLGTLILTSQRRGPREHIYLVLVIIVILSYLTDKLWELGGNWLFPYRNIKK